MTNKKEIKIELEKILNIIPSEWKNAPQNKHVQKWQSQGFNLCRNMIIKELVNLGINPELLK